MEKEQKKEKESVRILEPSKRARFLLKKHKKLIGSLKSLQELKQPVLLLMRRNKQIDVFEDVKATHYKIQHSSGEDLDIWLNKAKLYNLSYGKNVLQVYIHDEDSLFSMPIDPLFEIKEINIGMNKLLNDVNAWKAKEIRAKKDLIWTVFIGVAILIGLYIMAKLVFPEAVAPLETTVQNTVNNTITVLS